MKSAIIRWKQRFANPKRQRNPMKIEGVTEVGEGPHFIHVFCDGSDSITEVNLHHDQVESVTVVEIPDEPTSPLVDATGNPIGDEVQSAEHLPVEQDDAGSTPVVPAN